MVKVSLMRVQRIWVLFGVYAMENQVDGSFFYVLVAV